MRWWPVAAGVSAAALVLSLSALVAAPSVVRLCDEVGEPGRCDALLLGARSLVVASGAFFAASLVAGLYATLLTRALHVGRGEVDERPLVSLRARRRQ